MKKLYLLIVICIIFKNFNFAQTAQPQVILEDEVEIYLDASKKIKVVIRSSAKMKVKIKITDESGLTIYDVVKQEEKGKHSRLIDLARAHAGRYTVEVENDLLKQVEIIEIE